MYKITCDERIIAKGNVRKAYYTTKHMVLGWKFMTIEEAEAKIEYMKNNEMFDNRFNYKVVKR